MDKSSGATVWITGLPGSGKSTTARGLSDALGVLGYVVHELDGDALRQGINSDLGYSKDDRFESIRRTGELALMLALVGTISIVSLVSPYSSARNSVRRRHDEADVAFLEVWLSAPIEVCEKRGPRHLYERARQGDLAMMTGINDPYEAPTHAELVLPTDTMGIDEAVSILVNRVHNAVSGDR